MGYVHRDTYWYDNPHILMDQNHMTDFWPLAHTSKAEQVNALSRFILYSGLVLTTLRRNMQPFVAALVVLLFVSVLSNTDRHHHPDKNKTYTKSEDPKHTTRVKQSCKKPTKENPFANVLMNEYKETPQRDPACPYDQVKDSINDKFEGDLYMDIGDLYGRKTMSRQFYTMPNTKIPNDQTSFAKWCYDTGDTCKSNPDVCTGFD